MKKRRRYVLYKNGVVFDRSTKKYEVLLPEFIFSDGFIRFDEPTIMHNGKMIKVFETVAVGREEFCRAKTNCLNDVLYGRV